MLVTRYARARCIVCWLFSINLSRKTGSLARGCKRHSRFCTPQWKENLRSVGGDRERARWKHDRGGGTLQLTPQLNILSFYLRCSFFSSAGWILIFGNISFIKHIYFQVQLFHVCSYRRSFMTLSSTNLSCNVTKTKGNVQGTVSAVIKCTAATSRCGQLWSTASFDQKNIYSHIPNILFFFFALITDKWDPSTCQCFTSKSRAEFKGLCLCLCKWRGETK